MVTWHLIYFPKLYIVSWASNLIFVCLLCGVQWERLGCLSVVEICSPSLLIKIWHLLVATIILLTHGRIRFIDWLWTRTRFKTDRIWDSKVSHISTWQSGAHIQLLIYGGTLWWNGLVLCILMVLSMVMQLNSVQTWLNFSFVLSNFHPTVDE